MSSRHSNAKTLIHNLALAEGISVEEVREEIQYAIDIGISRSSGPGLALWKTIKAEGEKPTPEEFIAFLLGDIH